jgi:two-component system, cell cycle response regulator
MSPRCFTLLLVEDSLPVLAELEDMFPESDFCLVHISGPAAKIIGRALETDVDLVFLNMDLASGLATEVLQGIHAHKGARHLPVLASSSADGAQRRGKLLQLGADVTARVQRYVRFQERLDKLQEVQSRLEGRVVTDAVTQVSNHRHFTERLEEEFRRSQRYDDPLGLILVELDHFEELRGEIGQEGTDRLLFEVAQCLRIAVRGTDLLARVGDAVFGVLLPKTRVAGALTLAERILVDIGSLPLKLTHPLAPSLGVSSYPQKTVLSAGEIVSTAQVALARAKTEGKSKICLYFSYFNDPSADPGASPTGRS